MGQYIGVLLKITRTQSNPSTHGWKHIFPNRDAVEERRGDHNRGIVARTDDVVVRIAIWVAHQRSGCGTARYRSAYRFGVNINASLRHKLWANTIGHNGLKTHVLCTERINKTC